MNSTESWNFSSSSLSPNDLKMVFPLHSIENSGPLSSTTSLSCARSFGSLPKRQRISPFAISVTQRWGVVYERTCTTETGASGGANVLDLDGLEVENIRKQGGDKPLS